MFDDFRNYVRSTTVGSAIIGAAEGATFGLVDYVAAAKNMLIDGGNYHDNLQKVEQHRAQANTANPGVYNKSWWGGAAATVVEAGLIKGAISGSTRAATGISGPTFMRGGTTAAEKAYARINNLANGSKLGRLWSDYWRSFLGGTRAGFRPTPKFRVNGGRNFMGSLGRRLGFLSPVGIPARMVSTAVTGTAHFASSLIRKVAPIGIAGFVGWELWKGKSVKEIASDAGSGVASAAEYVGGAVTSIQTANAAPTKTDGNQKTDSNKKPSDTVADLSADIDKIDPEIKTTLQDFGYDKFLEKGDEGKKAYLDAANILKEADPVKLKNLNLVLNGADLSKLSPQEFEAKMKEIGPKLENFGNKQTVAQFIATVTKAYDQGLEHEKTNLTPDEQAANPARYNVALPEREAVSLNQPGVPDSVLAFDRSHQSTFLDRQRLVTTANTQRVANSYNSSNYNNLRMQTASPTGGLYHQSGTQYVSAGVTDMPAMSHTSNLGALQSATINRGLDTGGSTMAMSSGGHQWTNGRWNTPDGKEPKQFMQIVDHSNG